MPAVVVGSPERSPFNIAREALAGCARIGVVGDHLTADIEGAQRAGLDAILVLTGAMSQTCLERAPIPPDLVLDSLAALPEASSSLSLPIITQFAAEPGHGTSLGCPHR